MGRTEIANWKVRICNFNILALINVCANVDGSTPCVYGENRIYEESFLQVCKTFSGWRKGEIDCTGPLSYKLGRTIMKLMNKFNSPSNICTHGGDWPCALKWRRGNGGGGEASGVWSLINIHAGKRIRGRQPRQGWGHVRMGDIHKESLVF